MTVRIILPHIRVMILHAGRRGAAFPSTMSKDRQNRPALTTRDPSRGGIIRLTFTA
jgi:hypothetical protein